MEIIGFGPSEETIPARNGETQIIEVNPDNMIRHQTPTKQVPGVALRIEDGWLAGSDRGEWGGELVQIDGSGEAIVVIGDNIEDIYLLGEEYVAVAGLAHLGLNSGMLYRLELQHDGIWTASPWQSLPGAPDSSWPVETGEILVNTFGGGSLLVSANGSMRMATCKK